MNNCDYFPLYLFQLKLLETQRLQTTDALNLWNREKYLQTLHLLKDQDLKYGRNSCNSVAAKPKQPSENEQCFDYFDNKQTDNTKVFNITSLQKNEN